MAKTNEKPNTEISTKNGSCTPHNCIINEIIRDNDVLQCRNCQRFVHYACSELPPYQIQACLQYRARKFECAKCITVTPILMEKIKTSKQRVTNNKGTNTECNGDDQQGLKSVTARLDSLERKIEKLVNKEDVTKESKQVSYADIAKAETKMQEMTMKAFIKSEREEERWMNSTKCNLMLHNLGENKYEETKEEQRKGDIDYVEEVIRNRMGLKVKILTAERIGVRNNETMFKTKRWRPCKVTLVNEEQKNQIMASVHKLGKLDFRVTDDFSKKEREIIKEWHRKAREKTMKEEDKSCVWKVRGSPRTKLYLKKISNTVTENDTL